MTDAGLTVVRIALTDGCGNSTAHWRFWTGTKKPTDEVYAAPREIGGDLKVSVHADGYCQLGPTQSVRDRLSPDDRHAVHRWHIDQTARPCVLASIMFHRSELRPRANPTERGFVAIEMPGYAHAMLILLATNLEKGYPWGSDLPAGSKHLLLERRSMAPVSVLVIPLVQVATGLHDARLARLGQGAAVPWALPVTWKERTFGWAVTADDRFPSILEVAYDSEPEPSFSRSHALFCGRLAPWIELPVSKPDGADLCAAIVVADEGVATLYLNEHARCDHSRLLLQADDVRAEFVRTGPDDGWSHADVGWYTWMVTRSAASRLPTSNGLERS